MADAAPPPPDEPALTLTDLPLPLALHIASLLPADARACAACVCRGWGAVLSDVRLWTRLNLSPSSGVRVRVTDAVLAGAAAKARGQLAALDVSGCDHVSFDAVLAVVRANGGALRELCAGVCEHSKPQTLDADHIESLLLAAPQLTACHADVFGWSSVGDARRMLRNEPPFQPLRLRTLRTEFGHDADEASVREVAADVAAHASLQRVELHRAPMRTLAALDAVVDAALARRFGSLRFWYCRLCPASVPALARLLSGDTLTELYIQDWTLLDGPSAALLGDALRANSTLTSFSLTRMNPWHDTDVAAALLGALTGHRSLHTLQLADTLQTAGEPPEAVRPAAGAALGALVAANAPAMTELDVSWCRFGDAVLRLLFDMLPHNTHLRTLHVAGNDMSEAFARDVLLPALRANDSLRELVAYEPEYERGNAFMNEAQALVAARGAAAAAAE
jgi:hypothetical protein